MTKRAFTVIPKFFCAKEHVQALVVSQIALMRRAGCGSPSSPLPRGAVLHLPPPSTTIQIDNRNLLKTLLLRTEAGKKNINTRSIFT